jgi:hypothetical protein
MDNHVVAADYFFLNASSNLFRIADISFLSEDIREYDIRQLR